jgi:hypothetical protein
LSGNPDREGEVIKADIKDEKIIFRKEAGVTVS